MDSLSCDEINQNRFGIEKISEAGPLDNSLNSEVKANDNEVSQFKKIGKAEVDETSEEEALKVFDLKFLISSQLYLFHLFTRI